MKSLKEEKKQKLTHLDSNVRYVIVFDGLSPGQSHIGGWVKSFSTFSLLLSLIAENIERQHSTQNTANDTPKKCTPEKIFKGNHICRSNSAS